ncbi:hypothetical protein E2P84_39785 [Burkholderia cepacia]|uniref:Fis family transcriptional regulator n=2 Tax=Burkholderiaceae TaxID=119060 RepID=A0AAX2REM8_BURCE|nr:hypothetical protein [Burkholderia sp. HAN2018]RQT64097.1 hypothetical protein DF045_34410 [Burkholderia cepacia]TES63388.1 hypothetical protein E2P84_39785 [Burkholderia cepacia]TES98238.1 hypothetical protein E3D36_29330 [Burkholderia cepacia]TEU31131.1 hypothetical protein E3D39_39655 [Burkholderia cepacia]
MSHPSRRNRRPLTKSMLLPLPSVDVRRLSLRFHLALAAMSSGHGSGDQFMTLLGTIYIAFFLRDIEVGDVDRGLYKRAEEALEQCMQRVEQGQPWMLLADERVAIEEMVTFHDTQLLIAPAHRYADAWERVRCVVEQGRPSPIPV